MKRYHTSDPKNDLVDIAFGTSPRLAVEDHVRFGLRDPEDLFAKRVTLQPN